MGRSNHSDQPRLAQDAGIPLCWSSCSLRARMTHAAVRTAPRAFQAESLWLLLSEEPAGSSSAMGRGPVLGSGSVPIVDELPVGSSESRAAGGSDLGAGAAWADRDGLAATVASRRVAGHCREAAGSPRSTSPARIAGSCSGSVTHVERVRRGAPPAIRVPMGRRPGVSRCGRELRAVRSAGRRALSLSPFTRGSATASRPSSKALTSAHSTSRC